MSGAAVVANAVLSVLAPHHLTVLANDHRPHRLATLERRNIKTLDSMRRCGETERLAERLKKGTPVFLSGRLRSASWRDDDENPHYLVEIQARNLQILHRTDLGANGAIDTDDTA